MKEIVKLLKLFADESRLRIVGLLSKKELCVCQIMGVLKLSQPLVSRNLSLIEREGFLESRREGKLMFYRVKDALPQQQRLLLSTVQELLKDNKVLTEDIKSLKDCEEFQKRTGKCGMEAFREFMKQQQKARR